MENLVVTFIANKNKRRLSLCLTHTHTHTQSLVTSGLKFHKNLLRIPTNLGKFKKLTGKAGHQMKAKNTKWITIFYGKQRFKDKL